MEDSYAEQEDEFDEGNDEEDEDDYDYRSGALGGKKSQSRSSFWGWMEQYFVRFTQQHLTLLKETKVAGDPSFIIPKVRLASSGNALF